MPVPSAISDLSTTPGLNSPAGSESPASIDDYLRTHAAFIRQVSDVSGTKAADADVVKLTGNQTIAGTKTFSSPIDIGSGGTGQATAAAAFNALKQPASETATGVVEFATTVEAAAGTDTTRAVTPEGVEAHMNANALGWGQTWQDVIGSRGFGITYTNATGRPICVSVSAIGNVASTWAIFDVSVAGVVIARARAVQNQSAATVSFIVPAGATYIVNSTGASASLEYWAELR